VIEPAIKEQFVELRSQGTSFSSIAQRLNVSKSTLIEWSKERKEDIGNMRQIHLETLREKYRMGAERRMELFAKQLDAVEGELSKRDLTTIATERLFDILAKLGRELNATDAPLTLRKVNKELELDPDVFGMVSEWEA
jgi:transposase